MHVCKTVPSIVKRDLSVRKRDVCKKKSCVERGVQRDFYACKETDLLSKETCLHAKETDPKKSCVERGIN